MLLRLQSFSIIDQFMNEYCRLKIIDACYKNKFCDWRLAHTLKSLSTWNRIYFVCVKKCHNKNRFRTAAAAAAPALASVANMTLYKNECTVEFGWCGVCQEYVIFWLELMSLSVCCFFLSFQCFFFVSPNFCFVSNIFSQCNWYFASLLRRFDQHFECHISSNAIDNHHILRSLFYIIPQMPSQGISE